MGLASGRDQEQADAPIKNEESVAEGALDLPAVPEPLQDRERPNGGHRRPANRHTSLAALSQTVKTKMKLGSPRPREIHPRPCFAASLGRRARSSS